MQKKESSLVFLLQNTKLVQFMIADMAMKIEASRLLTHKAAWHA
jgi:alkylation response protein AidB-like acyl-CoA dehydrogenase